MTTAPDFRELCAELLAAFEIEIEEMSIDNRLCARARSALATPPPEPPTVDDLNALWDCCGDYDEEGDHYGNIFHFARAVLKRWGAK